jgi:hypothetical protein
MYIDYKGVIISGIVAGILIGVMEILGICCWPVDIVVLLGAGALTLHLAGGKIHEQNDILVNGGAAGLIGGLSGGILYTIASTLTWTILSLAAGNDYYNYYRTICGTTPPTPLQSGVTGIVCCLPVLVVAGIVLGAVGALAYRALKNQRVTGSP